MTSTKLQHTCLVLFTLAHAASQLIQMWIDNPSCISAVPKCGDDLLVTRLRKDNVEDVVDAQLPNHLCFR
ncbi:hypothetical protein CRN80_08530 [Pseudomonas sp. FDAARGOS_380]|uniref:Secreted protein n=1 Tax=Pseudomonas libanensis TaxID=75588 RepID=A0ABR5MDV2_9PSED|nr:hypothetical protein CRN80_08530 [Pseudomonas sp. FDAARGOS_380]KPG77526.1 hypothetical protein AEQ48_04070 [Pseudomonas libanensis]